MFYEVNNKREIVRQVEVYPDITCGYASEGMQHRSFFTNEHPVPSIEVISSEKDLTAFEITANRFEDVWIKAISTPKKTC